MKYDSIVLSGGNIKGIGLLGALQYCLDNNVITNETDLLVGTSIGAIVCYLLVIGYKPVEVLTFIIKNAKILEDYGNVNYLDMVRDKGGSSYDKLQMMLETMTIEKVGRLYTLGMLKRHFNKSLVCVTYNFTKKQVEYLNPDDNPDIPAITACKMSSNIPIFFEKFKYNGCFYIDGGIYDNFPLDYPYKVGKKNPLCINIKGEYSDGESLNSYLFNMYKVMSNATTDEKIKIFTKKTKIINLQMPNLFLWDADYSAKSLIEVFYSGHKQAFESLESIDEIIQEDVDEGKDELC